MVADLKLDGELARIMEELADGARGPRDIAARLWRAGARGQRGSCENDPLSNYVRARLEAARPGEQFRVDSDDDLVNVLAMPGRRCASACVPGDVGEFVDGFDEGQWRRLRAVMPPATWRVRARRG